MEGVRGAGVSEPLLSDEVHSGVPSAAMAVPHPAKAAMTSAAATVRKARLPAKRIDFSVPCPNSTPPTMTEPVDIEGCAPVGMALIREEPDLCTAAAVGVT
ncbi:hypothetical protein KRMM14A1004_50750 [Krasilnikovia sp. MM14-A1004]